MPTPKKGSAKKKSEQSKYTELPGVFNQPGEWEGFVALVVGDAYPVNFYLDMLKIDSVKPEKIEFLNVDLLFNPKQMIDSDDEGDKKKSKSRAATRNKGTKNDDESKMPVGEVSQSAIASAIKSRLLELKAKDLASRPNPTSSGKESQEKSKKNKKGASRDTKRGKSAGKKSKAVEEKKEEKEDKEENNKNPFKNVVLDERPNKYFLISGATNLQLLDCLLAEGIVVNVVFKVSCTCNALNYAVNTLTTQDPEVECKQLVLNGKLQHFWRYARCFLTRKPTGSPLQDVLILKHLIDDCQYKRVVNNEAFAKELYDVFYSWFEQLVFFKRHYGFYLDALCLRHLSYAVSYKPPPIYPAVLSQQEEMIHQNEHPDEPPLMYQSPSPLVQQDGWRLKIQAPPTHLYHSMLNSLPPSLVSVPLILYCMREQVVQWDKIETNQTVDVIESCVCNENCSHNNNNMNENRNNNYLDNENNNNNGKNDNNNTPNKTNNDKKVVNQKALKHNFESNEEEEEEEENDKMNDDDYCCKQIIMEQLTKSIFSLALTNNEKKQLRSVLKMKEPAPPLPRHLRCPPPALVGYHDLINKRLMTSQARKNIEKCKVVDFDPLAAEIEMLHFTKGASILRKIEEMNGGLGAKKEDKGLGGDVGDGWCICGNTTVGSNECPTCYCCDGIIVNDLSQCCYKSKNDNDDVEKEVNFNELFEKCQKIFGCSITKPELHHLLTLLMYESMDLKELDDCQVKHPINSKITINPHVPIPWDDPYHFYLPKVGEDCMTKKQDDAECDVACVPVEVQCTNTTVTNNSEDEISIEKDPKAISTNINFSNCNTTQDNKKKETNEKSDSLNSKKEDKDEDREKSEEHKRYQCYLDTYIDPVAFAVEYEPMPTNTGMDEAGRAAQSVMKRIWKLQKRDLNDYDYEEALDPLSLVQCLNQGLLRDCHVTIQKRLSDGCFLVALESIFNKKERYIEDDWSCWLTSNCGFRNFYELIYPRIGLWLDGREVEYQGLRMGLLKEAMKSQFDDHKDDMQRCGFPNVEDSFYVKQNSLKAQLLDWQKSQSQEPKAEEEVQEKETKNKKKSGKNSKKKKGKDEDEDEAEKDTELKSAKKDLVLFQKPPTLPKELKFFGYDVGDSMVDISGISSNMHPLDGGVIKTDHIHFFPDRLYVKSSLLKDDNYLTVQVINPRMCCCCYPSGCAICNKESTKEKKKPDKENNNKSGEAGESDQKDADQDCEDGGKEETEKDHQKEEEERIICCEHCSEVMPEFASFVGNFHDKLFISFSVFGQDGRPQLIENVTSMKESKTEQQEDATTEKTPAEENDKNKKRSGKEKKESKAEKRTKSKNEESEKDKSEAVEENPEVKETQKKSCPPFTQTFLQLNASTSDAIEISFMLENTLGVRATNDYDRCLVVKLNKTVFQSDSVESKCQKMTKKDENPSCNPDCLFDFESSHELKCDGHDRWQLNCEKSRYVTVDGDVVIALEDASFKVLFSDGAIKMYQKMPIECLRRKMENMSTSTSKDQVKETEDSEDKTDKKHRKDQKNASNNTSEQTVVNEDDLWCCITTMADGRRYYQDKFVMNAPLAPLKFYTVTDPCTLEKITVRDDRTMRIERPDGSVTVEFEDFTRISTIKMLPLNSCTCAFSKKVTTKFCVEHPVLPSVHYNGSTMSVDLPHIECCIVAHPKGGYIIKDTSKPGVYSELVVSPHGVSAYLTLPIDVAKEKGVFYKPVSTAEADSEPKISGEGVFKAICSCYKCEMCCDICGSCEECHLPQLNFAINPVPTNTFMVMRNVFTMLHKNLTDGSKSCISGDKSTSKEGNLRDEKIKETNETKNNNNKNVEKNNFSQNNNDYESFGLNQEPYQTDNKKIDPSNTNVNNCCVYDENLAVTVKNCIENFEETLLKTYYSPEASMGITYNISDIKATETVEEEIICSDQGEFSGTPQINFTASNVKANKTNQIYFLRHYSSVLVETIDITNRRYRVMKNGATDVNFEVFNPLGTECFPEDEVTNFLNDDTLRLFKINGGKSFGCGRTGTEFLKKDQVEKFIENFEKNQVTKEKMNKDNEDLLAITTMKKVIAESDKRSVANEKNSYRSVVSPYKDDIIPLGLVNRPFKDTCSKKPSKEEDPCCNGGGDEKKKCDSDLLFEMRKFYKYRNLSKEVRKKIEKCLKEITDLKMDDKDLKKEWKNECDEEENEEEEDEEEKEAEEDEKEECEDKKDRKEEKEAVDNCNDNCRKETVTEESNENNNFNEKKRVEGTSVNINANNSSKKIFSENKNNKRDLSNENIKVVLSTSEINFGCVKEGHTYRYKLILNNGNPFESKRFLVKHPTPNSGIKAFYLNNLLPKGGKASIDVEVYGVMSHKKENIILNHPMKIFILKIKDNGEKFSFDNGLSKIEQILECSIKAVVVAEGREKQARELNRQSIGVKRVQTRALKENNLLRV